MGVVGVRSVLSRKTVFRRTLMSESEDKVKCKIGDPVEENILFTFQSSFQYLPAA